jgi:hypothetical protein
MERQTIPRRDVPDQTVPLTQPFRFTAPKSWTAAQVRNLIEKTIFLFPDRSFFLDLTWSFVSRTRVFLVCSRFVRK